MSESVSYQQIHAYMLKKTQEYYLNPPQALVDAVLCEYQKKGITLTYTEACRKVSPIAIQRLVKQEMQEKWPEFMASIPANPLRSE